jgi:hypothetical protein
VGRIKLNPADKNRSTNFTLEYQNLVPPSRITSRAAEWSVCRKGSSCANFNEIGGRPNSQQKQNKTVNSSHGFSILFFPRSEVEKAI